MSQCVFFGVVRTDNILVYLVVMGILHYALKGTSKLLA